MSDSHQTTVVGEIHSTAATFGPYSPITIGQRAPSADDPEASRLLLVVAADVERETVMGAVADINGAPFTRRFIEHHTIYELGRIGRTDLMLAQVAQGTVRPDAAGVAVPALIDAVRPDFVVLVGMCYGLGDDHPEHPQRLGDVLIASDLLLVAHHRLGAARIDRGGMVHPSSMLIDRLRTARVDWPGAANVHIGPMISESVLVNSADYRRRLKRRYPEAIGGEMEGAAVYAAAIRGGVHWAVVKGISDWGMGKTGEHQRLAAGNAASLVVHAVRIGGLDPTPGDNRVRM